MTTMGKQTARPPVSRHPNLTTVARVGTTECGSAVWQLECTCGAVIKASVPTIKTGGARCATCNPSLGKAQADAILAALPAGYDKIIRKTKLSEGQVQHRISCMRKEKLCFVGDWKRSEGHGGFRPVFHAGPGKDVPCDLERRTAAEYERNYRKRVRRAIQKVKEGGKEDPRYAKKIGLYVARTTVAAARKQPCSWFAALEMRL